MSYSRWAGTGLLAFILLGAPAFATAPEFAEVTPFSAGDFEAAQKAGKPILVEIHASWCPTCKAQIPILKKLRSMPKFSQMVILRVDFDDQKKVVRKFRVQIQSTLIVFKGGKEIGRSVGDTDPRSIEALLSKAV